MEDNLKDYIESQVGFMDDDLYYAGIKQLSEEFMPKEIRDDLKAYAETHRSDFIGQEAIDYVKMRIRLFELLRKNSGGNYGNNSTY